MKIDLCEVRKNILCYGTLFYKINFKISIRQGKQLVRYLKESSIEIMENVVMQKKITKRKFIQYPNV